MFSHFNVQEVLLNSYLQTDNMNLTIPNNCIKYPIIKTVEQEISELILWTKRIKWALLTIVFNHFH